MDKTDIGELVAFAAHAKESGLKRMLIDPSDLLDLCNMALDGDWIPVSERLPNSQSRVLVWIDNYVGPMILRCMSPEWWVIHDTCKTFSRHDMITHWKPITKPEV